MERTVPPEATETDTSTVACPQCGRRVAVSVPDRDVELRVRSHVAAFGDHHVVHCEAGHKFWVYFC